MAKQNNLSACLSFIIVYLCINSSKAAATQSHWLDIGFRANSNPSISQFQPLLSDLTSNFSLGFLKANSSNFELAVVHVPSTLTLWKAPADQQSGSSGSVSLSFNGSLVFSDQKTGRVLWSNGKTAGNRVLLLNSSNLQILKLTEVSSVLWQSFDFPTDTIVQDQNFTSASTLFSENQRYAMKLGSNYMALFMEFGQGVEKPMYWRRTALQSKNQIVAGQGPLYARVDPASFIGLYQRENASVDVVPFDSFGRGIPGFRRLILENDGNLRGYYWNGTVWDSDYAAIAEFCDLPSACGPYGLCQMGESKCGCIDNRSSGCLPPDSGDVCQSGNDFSVLRTKGVDLGNREVLGFIKVQSAEECEGLCKRNCSCWGAVFNNVSGYCYAVNYPVQTVVAVGDEKKIGYFKLKNTKKGGGNNKRRTAEVLLILGVLAAFACCGVVVYRLWSTRRRRRMRNGADCSMVEGLSPGPYKDLSSNSFRSIELVDSFRK